LIRNIKQVNHESNYSFNSFQFSRRIIVGPQITGTSGAIPNVFGEKQATELPAQSMGQGENSAVAMAQMQRNRAAYQFDSGSPESLLRPLIGYPSAAAGAIKKAPDNAQIES
jgi:hypothetical protein